MKTLYCFDFDGTLVHSPTPELGKPIWQDRTGDIWPYNGWWGKSESLDTNIFHVPKHEWVHKRYLEAQSDENRHLILATGRLRKVNMMRENVDIILEQHGFSFDEIHLNWGEDTYNFKIKLFEETIEKIKCDRFVMYDDRHEHLVKFREWATKQKISIEIVDIVNKETHKFN